MIKPGRYRAVTAIAIERCRRNGLFVAPAVIDYVSYQPGEEFEIPGTVNGFYFRVMEDPSREEPSGTYERIAVTTEETT